MSAANNIAIGVGAAATLAAAVGLVVSLDMGHPKSAEPVDERRLASIIDLPDGGVAPGYTQADGGVKTLSEWPCAWKARKADACFRSDGGTPPLRSTMQAEQFIGAGCTRKQCVNVYGELDESPDERIARKATRR